MICITQMRGCTSNYFQQEELIAKYTIDKHLDYAACMYTQWKTSVNNDVAIKEETE